MEKNNTPQCAIIEFIQTKKIQEAKDENLLNLSKRIIKKIEKHMRN